MTGCTLTPAGTGKLLVEWPHARRAEAYRVMLKIIGTDPEPVQVERTESLEFTLKGLAPGAQVEVSIIATNEGGDAPACPAATGTVPA